MAYVYREYRTHGKPWCMAYKGVDGRLRRERTDAPTKELARKFLSRRLVEVTEAKVAGLKVEPSRITFSEFLPEYLRYIEARKTPGSKTRDVEIIQHLKPAFGTLRLSDVTSGMVQRYVDGRMHERTPSRKVYRPATINRELTCLSAIFREAVKRGYVVANPCRGIKQLPEENTIVRYLAPDEEERLLAACSTSFRPIVLCALHTGMRREEILKLEWQDVDLIQGIVRVRNTKSKRTRYIPINAVLRGVLEMAVRYEGCPFVFANPDTRTRWSDKKISWRWTVKRAGVANFRFHDLRHTFASRLVQSGVSLRVVQELLGHASITTTMRYSHLAADDLRRAVEILAVKPPAPESMPSPRKKDGKDQ